MREATVPCFYSLRFELTGVIYKRANGVVTSPTNVKAINVLCTVIEYSLFFNVPSYWQLLCIVLATSVEFRIHFRGGFTCSYSDSAFVETTDSAGCFCKLFFFKKRASLSFGKIFQGGLVLLMIKYSQDSFQKKI